MTSSKALLALVTLGTLAISMPALAAGINQSTGRPGGGGGDNPLSNNRGNDMNNVNPNNSTGCVGHDSQGQQITVACPDNRTIEQSKPVNQAPATTQPY